MMDPQSQGTMRGKRTRLVPAGGVVAMASFLLQPGLPDPLSLSRRENISDPTSPLLSQPPAEPGLYCLWLWEKKAAEVVEAMLSF